MKRPGFPGAVWFGSCCGIEFLLCGIIVGLGVGGGDVADGAEEATIVEPVHPPRGAPGIAGPARRPASSRSQRRSVSAVPPIVPAIDTIASHFPTAIRPVLAHHPNRTLADLIWLQPNLTPLVFAVLLY